MKHIAKILSSNLDLDITQCIYISKNEPIKGLKYVTQFVQNRRNTNVIRMNASHRFDLEVIVCE